jgi:hypothetical protein
MTRRTLMALAVLVPTMVLARGEFAAAVDIDFENVPGVTAMGDYFDGMFVVPPESRLTNQLQLSRGVTFSSTAGYVALIFLNAHGTDGHATSGVNGIGGVDEFGVLRYHSPVIITFTLPGDPTTPAVTDSVSIRGDNFPNSNGFAMMEAFDVDGVLLKTTGWVPDTAGFTLGISVPNIHSVRITQTLSDIAFDDLHFNPLSRIGQPPTAVAGEPQSIHAGQLVTLDGRASFDDNTPTALLTFSWTLTGKPDGSSATLTNADTAQPSFVADLPGTYAATLVVTDTDGMSSAPATVVVSSENGGPVADAGPDQGTFVGDTVSLNGSLSQDPDLDPLAFSWTLTRPAGSAAVLTGATTAFPTLTPDVPGSYTATLTVTDPFGVSAADSMDVSVITSDQFAAALILRALNLVGAMPREQVTSRGNQHALQNFLTQVLTALHVDDVDRARDKLAKSIDRTDGCALRGSPDDGDDERRDWVSDCAAQARVYELLTTALGALTP